MRDNSTHPHAYKPKLRPEVRADASHNSEAPPTQSNDKLTPDSCSASWGQNLAHSSVSSAGFESRASRSAIMPP